MGEVDQRYDFDEETDKTDPTGDIDQGLEEGNLEMPSDTACEYKSSSVYNNNKNLQNSES